MAKHDHDFWSAADQSVASTDRVPRWLILFALVLGLTLALVLLRYAIDLLGLVFVIVAVGFTIRALTDWLTDAESVSFWSIAAVCMGLAGTFVVGTWLFGSRPSRRGAINIPVPSFMSEAIGWAESKGWGDRVMLAGPAGDEHSESGGRYPADVSLDYEPVDEHAPRRPLPTTGAMAHPSGSSSSERSTTSPTELRAPTSTALSVTPGRTPAGRPVRLLAVVRTGRSGEVPDGTVVFWRDGVVLGSASLGSVEGRAVTELTAHDLPVGDSGLSAEYVGTDRFRTSRSPVVHHLVEP
jgi:hypothetical protein